MARDRQDASFDRRQLLKTVGAAALLGACRWRTRRAAAAAEGPTYPVTFRGMPGDGPGRPRICLGAPATADDAQLRRLKQIGVSHVLMGGPTAPWKEDELKARLDRFKAGGVEIINMMIGGFNDVIWGGPKAEEQTANVVESIKVAGKLGLPVVEYNFYAHRLTEGYKLEEGRAGAGYTAYDYDAVEGSAAARGRRHAHAGTAARTRPAIPQDDRAGGREGQCPPRPAPQRSAGAAVAAAPSRSWPPSSTGRPT